MITKLGGQNMDIQLYLDNIVYPTLDLLLQDCIIGKLDKKAALKIAKSICNMKSCSFESMKGMCGIMGDDALAYFKERLNKL